MPHKSTPITYHCDNCGKPLYRRPFEFRDGIGQFCNRQCSAEYRKRQPKIDPAVRFWAKVDRRGPDACWPFTGGLYHFGHGAFYLNGKPMRAHRFAWLITRGAIPDGVRVLHRCDNPPCCNPAHLFLGTDADNIHDMMRKGRRVLLRGEADPKSKLTDAQVREIRRLYKPRKVSQYKLAIMFGVHRSTIQAIICGYNWQHLK